MGAPMTWIEHLEELRQRLLWSVVGLALGTALSWSFSDALLRILLRPSGGIQLHAIGMLEPFLARFRVAVTGGLVLSMPWIVYHVFRFIDPALEPHERRVLIPVALAAGGLFAFGVVFGYFFLLPSASKWLLSQAGEVIRVQITALNYLSFVTWFLVATGLGFETPLLVVAACALGIVTPQRLQREWRTAVLAILVLSAAVTPDWSPVTMFLLALPMIVLYEGAVLVSFLIVRRRAQKAQDAALEA
ncbi:MAG: twin-arginine translocase subunit TatC [Armatimonadota bacterium]|nr:twin-arginine translocase subunit TatC [Armatimonadota bacterium]MDR7444354.1 twin-arginine translocase subunit TatC [Armatimonadota bacterium]MDR7569655.1 twin-arginine translocase subunit TatC [Armatimonadota bacterium]MDR7614841.1 twin-arginine translocase subunit TatC [Armatimonadota bacterium]